MIAWLRTLLFRIVFYGGSVVIVGTAPLVAKAFGQAVLVRHARVWSRFHHWCARVLLGIRIVIEGQRPREPVLYAVKHQGMFETIEGCDLFGGPTIVIKRELTNIPVWGWVAQAYGAIVVDREGSAKMLRQMMAEATVAKATGRSILIFPEGTRVSPGEQPPLRSGFAGLYRVLKMPVVPVAMDSGVLVPRKGAKRAGVMTFRFGAAIPPGLPREEIEARVHAAINALDIPA
ncbi:glycerol acyltransferase [Sphingomonas sp. Leaf17]|uniref:lysophospholipid acyltransferase family protein n=1 Tax=Sphingomonas sp. Leaf17 TaxID=1735683 RepID=UPI0007002E16|nr:1-acyl-sn-glycerol-3-phosphate acyltransferase [Sphingomonas sp. Leaf17]KQM62517.1 glycerol acyltransferase [Sphingomonas sp. Leaf17]